MNIKYGCMYNLYILYKKDKYIYTVIKCLLFFPLQLQFWVYSIQEKSNKIGYQRKKYKRINEDLSKTILEEESFQKYLKVYVEKI